MLLTIDIGNTNITLGVWDGRRWLRTWRVMTSQARTTDEYGILLHAFLQEANLPQQITAVILASVVPALTKTFVRVGEQYLRCPVTEVTIETDLGLQVATDQPAAVGTDRLVNAVAALETHPGPSIIIDMGTATKFDVVTGDRVFVGGVIAPGLHLAAEALSSRAARLSHVALSAPPATIGRNTVEAMQSGIIFGYAALITGLVARIRAEHPDAGQPITVLGTGGNIELMRAHLPCIDHFDPWLTITGLRCIQDRLTKGKGA